MTRITPLVGQVLAKARIVGLVAAAVVLTAGTAQAVVASGDPTPVGDEVVVVDEPVDPATTGGEDQIPVVDEDPPVVVEEPTDPAQRANWLPAPKGDFSLYIRSYWPEAAITEGMWTPPPVVMVK